MHLVVYGPPGVVDALFTLSSNAKDWNESAVELDGSPTARQFEHENCAAYLYIAFYQSETDKLLSLHGCAITLVLSVVVAAVQMQWLNIEHVDKEQL